MSAVAAIFTVVLALATITGAPSASAATTADVQLTVTIVLPNHPPVAITTGPYSAGLGMPVELSGSPSYDPDPGDTITKYEWDLDNNGSFETTGMHASTTFNQIGSYTVRLRVTDSHGLTDITETTVAVTDVYAIDYQYTSRIRIDRFVTELGLAVKCKNDSPAEVKNVKLTLTGVPASYTIVDNSAVIGDVPAGQEKWSPDNSIIIRQDRRIPVQPNEQFMWTLEFDDLDGTHHIIPKLTQAR